MADEIVKASIVFGPSGGGIAGAAGGSAGGTSGAASQGGREFGKAMNLAVTLPITDLLGGIAKGVDKLVSFSPLLQAEQIRFQKGLQLLLMPIGNILANNLRPFTNAWMKSARKFYADYESGGLISALAGAIGAFFSELGWVDESGNLSITGILENADEIMEITGVLLLSAGAVAGGITIAKLLAGSIAGMTLTGAGVLAVTGFFILAWGSMPDEEKNQMSEDVINFMNDTATIAGNSFAEKFRDFLKPSTLFGTGMFGIGGGMGEAIQANIFGREGEIITEIQDGTLTLKEEIPRIPPIWEKAWNAITDALGISVTPALDDMGVQLEENDIKVSNLASSLIQLPNIARTITYTIRYVTQGSSRGRS
jgi:hypothetical protein